MSARHRALALVLIASFLIAGCGTAAPTTTPVAATANRIVQEATSPSPPLTSTSLTPTPTETPNPPTETVTSSPTATPMPTATVPPTPTATEATGGQLIAFTSDREDGEGDIYIMNADGVEQGSRNPQRLTDDPAYDGWPSWSPDGSQIAFMSERSGNPDIYVMNADGSNVRQLTDHPANDIWPEWSPDGTRIAFPSRRDGNFEIYVINADGTNLQRLTNTPGHEDFPTWSPDGTQILFSRIEGNDGTYVMNADGSNERRLLDFRVFEPAWSPAPLGGGTSGTRIAFGSDHEGFRAIYAMDVADALQGTDGGNLEKLSNTVAGENCPSWSPDGTRLAFASWRDGDGEIYVMDADGGNLKKLTDNRFEDEFPAWRPAPSPSNGSNEFEPAVVTYGGPRNDRAFDVLVTEDGGSLIAGLANNTRLSHRITPGNAWLLRTDPEGAILWEKEYGGEDDAYFSSIIQVGKDEYVLLGEIAASYVRDETDLYLLKVDGEGNELWSRTFGGRGMDLGKMVRQTADGGYILIGDQADEYPTGNVYESNIYLIKTDAEGNMVWSRTYGDEILYLGWGVAQTPDGGYVLTGWEAKTIDDRDVILIKTDELGEVEWSRTWDLGERDGGFDLILTSDGYIVIACIQSMGSGAPSAVLLKVDLDGNEIWNKLIGEEGVGNTFWGIAEDSDGGYVLAGDTHLGKMPGTGEDIHGGLMIKTDVDGEILWQHIFSEGAYEQVSFNSVGVLPDGGYVFVGRAIPSGEKFWDMLWLKLTLDETPALPIPLTKAQQDAPSEFEGKVDVGGYEMYLHCMGTGTPTVILEAGYGDVAGTWSLVQPEVARFTRACAYDRVGLGQSDPRPESRNSLQVVKELHALLDKAGIEGPYVLAGHSLGGMYVRLYADRYLEDVVGLVLVDSSHVDQFWRSAAVLPPESPNQSESLRFYREWFTNPPAYPTLHRRLFEAGSLGDMPLVVLTSPVKERPDDLPPGLSAKFDEIWVELQKEWAKISSHSTHVIAYGSGHFIQHDQPDLVIDAILQVVDDARH